jgi:acetyltransferase-like isoleucine patch superfamily enzyme
VRAFNVVGRTKFWVRLIRPARRFLGRSAPSQISTVRPGLDDLLARGVVTVGRRTNLEFRVAYYPGDTAKIRVGSFCSIAADVELIPGGNHRHDWVTTYPVRFGYRLPGALEDGHPASKGDIVIGDDVWIGRGAKILSGVTIGTGAVVGAYSVVTQDVDEYAIAVGNPARHVRYRFSEEIRRKLLDIAWWDWDDDAIRAAASLLSSPDLDAFVRSFGETDGSAVGSLG